MLLFLLGTYCELPANCEDMAACRLNFKSNVTCNISAQNTSMGNTRVPYTCINLQTNQSCTNDSQCCNRNYRFVESVQQCLC